MSGLKYGGSRVLLGFFCLGCLGLSVPMERLTSGLSMGLRRMAESSGCTFGFLGVMRGRCTYRANFTGFVGGFGPWISESSGGLVVSSSGIVNLLEIEKAPTTVEAKKLPHSCMNRCGQSRSRVEWGDRWIKAARRAIFCFGNRRSGVRFFPPRPASSTGGFPPLM